MKFVISWKIRPGHAQEAVNRFIGTGDPLPAGVKSIGRWHRVDLQSGIHVVESNDAAAMALYAAQWTDLLDLESYAVVEDAEVVPALQRINGVAVGAKA